MYRILFLLLLCFTLKAGAATVDTVSITSQKMQKTFRCVVIKPEAYKKKNTACPAVYLLHGYSGNYSNWIIRVPQLKQFADTYGVLIVCPDGGYSSWYLDSPVDSTMRYETYIGTEVPAYIDAHYRTIKRREGRAITGLSMGGHGGLFLGLRHAGRFGACGSMSGGVDLYDTRSKFDLVKRVGDTLTHAGNWKQLSVMNVVEQYPKDSVAIIMDCGVDDFFYDNNRELHEKMVRLKIPHDYIERPGKHNWDYWAIAVEYQLLFFRNYFDKSKAAQ
ncbi:MAG TPA: alpha/beta hydrolase family protein [Chitinophagaceae bacterium]